MDVFFIMSLICRNLKKPTSEKQSRAVVIRAGTEGNEEILVKIYKLSVIILISSGELIYSVVVIVDNTVH